MQQILYSNTQGPLWQLCCLRIIFWRKSVLCLLELTPNLALVWPPPAAMEYSITILSFYNSLLSLENIGDIWDLFDASISYNWPALVLEPKLTSPCVCKTCKALAIKTTHGWNLCSSNHIWSYRLAKFASNLPGASETSFLIQFRYWYFSYVWSILIYWYYEKWEFWFQFWYLY